MNKTSIAWTDYTSNPIRARNIETGKVGHYCTHVSEGCENCYAGVWNRDRFGTGLDFIAQNRNRVEMFLVEEELREWSKPKYAGAKVFVCDMTDWCHELVTDEMRDKLFAAMRMAPEVTFQLLTKRPEKMREYFTKQWLTIEKAIFEGGPWPEAYNRIEDQWLNSIKHYPASAVNRAVGWQVDHYGPETSMPWPLPNVWLGVTAENQRWSDERIPVLLDTPAAVRFVSAEPLLGPVSLMSYLPDPAFDGGSSHTTADGVERWDLGGAPCQPLDWVIVGGESGANPRSFELDWARLMKRQCELTGVAFFMKQMGGKRFPDDRLESLPEDLRVREFPR